MCLDIDMLIKFLLLIRELKGSLFLDQKRKKQTEVE